MLLMVSKGAQVRTQNGYVGEVVHTWAVAGVDYAEVRDGTGARYPHRVDTLRPYDAPLLDTIGLLGALRDLAFNANAFAQEADKLHDEARCGPDTGNLLCASCREARDWRTVRTLLNVCAITADPHGRA